MSNAAPYPATSSRDRAQPLVPELELCHDIHFQDLPCDEIYLTFEEASQLQSVLQEAIPEYAPHLELASQPLEAHPVGFGSLQEAKRTSAKLRCKREWAERHTGLNEPHGNFKLESLVSHMCKVEPMGLLKELPFSIKCELESSLVTR